MAPDSTKSIVEAQSSSNAQFRPLHIGVCADSSDKGCRRRATELAGRLGLSLVDADDGQHGILLAFVEDRLELRLCECRGPNPLFVDFANGPLGYASRINRFGMLFQAVGFRSGRPRVLDVTAGMGHDAFRLAYHGCEVNAVERSSILHALLEDGLARAASNPELHAQLGDRLHLIHADARDVLRELAPDAAPDVIYLDPMFPPKKKSALAKAEMRILRQLVGDDPDAGELFAMAMNVARKRVVVKRHRHAAALAPSPTHSHGDKTTRFDVYMTGTNRG